MKLSDSFTYKKLLKFTFPTIIMMIFTSIYCIVDGFFISNFACETYAKSQDAFEAVNLVYPFLLILGSFGFMFGTGAAALISKYFGQGKNDQANNTFSLVVYFSIIIGVVLSVIGLIFLKPFCLFLGAEDALLSDSLRYGQILLLAIPFFVLQYEFQCLFTAAEKPKLGFIVTLIAGITNMVLDALFVVVFKFGLEGAAVASALAQVVGGIIPIIYFARPNSSKLRLSKIKMSFKDLLKTFTNGSSELVSNIAMNLVSIVYSFQLLRIAPEGEGLAIYGVLMYVCMIFQAIFFGFTTGSSPIVSYHFGSNNHKELKNLFKKSVVLIFIFSFLMFIIGFIFARPIALIYLKDAELIEATKYAFRIFSVSFLFFGFTIFASAFFTALNNGLISMLISSLKSLVFYILSGLIIPYLFGMDGVWWSIVVAEGLAFITSLIFIVCFKKKYRY